jgi:tRNA(Ile2) C34 agmatinyltransferase TiaS
MIYIGLDDTDNKTSRGTGRLARAIAAQLAQHYTVLGITRHQLLFDPRVPYTSHNSSATIHLHENGIDDLSELADTVQAHMLADWQEGSDPGLCVTRDVTDAMIAFGQQAKQTIVRQSDAYEVANRCGCILRGLGGTRDGVIGALAGVGLAGSGQDGRFILLGSARDLQGVHTFQTILESGVAEIRPLEGQLLERGLVDTRGKLRPAFRDSRPVLFVAPHEEDQQVWVPVKLD